MDKKEFFESFISLLPDNSGHRLIAFGKIQGVFASIKSRLASNLQEEFEPIEQEILFRVWMLEQICNGDISGETMSWPLIVMYISWEILFANRAYCQSSGLSPAEIRSYARTGTLQSHVYEGEELNHANEGISRLQAGKWYEHLELLMKHSGRKISWNSYGGLGESLEIRSGVEIRDKNDQKKEYERLDRGYTMNTARLLENIYHITLHDFLPPEDGQWLAWIQEFLAMFDFLWNHSELFMEITEVSTVEKNKISGWYNTVYAQFFRYSFQEQKKFKDLLLLSHGNIALKLFETNGTETLLPTGIQAFRQYDKRPVATMYWKYSIYPYEPSADRTRILGIGTLLHRIPKKNIFIRIFRSIFGKNDTPNT